MNKNESKTRSLITFTGVVVFVAFLYGVIQAADTYFQIGDYLHSFVDVQKN